MLCAACTSVMAGASLSSGTSDSLRRDALEDDLAGRRIGLFSYGSGATGEFFTGIVQPGYRSSRRAAQVQEALEARVPIALPEYRELHARVLPSDTDVETERVTTAPYRFAGIRGRARVYEATGA